MTRLRSAWPFLILGILVVAAYGAALNNEYVWDDKYFVTYSAGLDNAAAALETAFSPLFSERAYVRPLPLLSFYVEALPVGRSPAISHAINLLLHLLAAGLVYLLALRAIRETGMTTSHPHALATMLASIFAVHPALTETVAWVSSRFDLMVSVFMLLALWIAGLQWRDWPRALAIGLCFFLAALSKESAVVLPVVLVIYQWIRNSTHTGAAWKRTFHTIMSTREIKAYASILAFGVAYLILRHFILLNGYSGLDKVEITIADRLTRTGLSVAKYLQLTLLPFSGNSPQHSFYWNDGNNFQFYIPQLLITASFLIATTWLASKNKAIGWLMLAWLVAYAPVLHLLSLTIGNNLIQQRFMYFPTAILFAFSPYVLTHVRLSEVARKTAWATCVLFILISVIVVRSIVPVWGTELALWKWTVQMDPLSPDATGNLILAYMGKGMFDEMDREFDQLVKSGKPYSYTTLINMGNSQQGRLNYPKALDYYNQAMAWSGAMTPENKSSLTGNMAVAYALTGENAKAREHIEIAVNTNPRNFMAIANLAAFCKKDGFDSSYFRQVELERSRKYSEYMLLLLQNMQPSALANPHRSEPLCPDAYKEAQGISHLPLVP